MKSKLITLLTIFLAIACGTKNTKKAINQSPTSQKNIPIPTQVYENIQDEEEFEERRNNYFDLIHGNHPNWREMNQQQHQLLAEQRIDQLQSRATEIFAEGAIEAEWRERGSKDIPGNIRICDYHPATDDIYVISDGGILWKGNLDGETWVTLNDGVQLGRTILKVIDLPEGGVRILAANNHRLKYSDDYGVTWNESDGFAGTQGSGSALYQLNDENKTLIYLYHKNGVLNRNKLAYSTDNGVSFEFVADLESSAKNFVSIHVAHGSSVAYILDHNDAVYKFEEGSLTLLTDDLGLDGDNRCMIRANEAGGTTTLYALFDNSKLYKSIDGGTSFSLVSVLATSTWAVGFNVSINNPSILYAGDVNLRKSTDGGETFTLVSEWWEYYGDVSNKIHADIMAISPFKKLDGTEITLVCNHGGISASYDNLSTTPNIAMQNLNTGQFYDVLTSPTNPSLIYGGTQDQGFQRTLEGGTPTPSSFEQVISGDYGEMQFTNNGITLWSQYPGAWFQVYPNAETDGGYAEGYDINGTNMPNYDWIVPTGAAPHPEDNFIYAGGGNLEGGSGSYLIKMSYTDGESITASQFDFNFYSAAGAAISAIETTPLQDEFIYVVTENGRFFHSEDEGATFEATPSYSGPSGSWIYTADIYASRITPGLVFVGGTNYGSSCVYISTDSAKTFSPLTGDIPNTMVHEMTMDVDEKFLFAATDAGPYVYSIDEEKWYYIGGVSAPIQNYISVEYIPTKRIVRFATWGRGIWDFEIASLSFSTVHENKNSDLKVYPNPSVKNGPLTITVGEKGKIMLYDLTGKKVIHDQIITSGTHVIDTKNLNTGTFILNFTSESGATKTAKISIQ